MARTDCLIYHRQTSFRLNQSNRVIKTNTISTIRQRIEIPERLNPRGMRKIARLLLSLGTGCISPPGSHLPAFNHHAKPSTNAVQYFKVLKLSSIGGRNPNKRMLHEFAHQSTFLLSSRRVREYRMSEREKEREREREREREFMHILNPIDTRCRSLAIVSFLESRLNEHESRGTEGDARKTRASCRRQRDVDDPGDATC